MHASVMRSCASVAVTACVWVLSASMVAATALNDVDQYSVTYTSPSTDSLGAMPIGNGRSAANVWVDAATGDVKLLLALADALDENSNLLKLGTVAVRLKPPLFLAATNSASDIGGAATTTTDFNQTLVLSTATVEVSVGDVQLSVWVDANTSAVLMVPLERTLLKHAGPGHVPASSSFHAVSASTFFSTPLTRSRAIWRLR